MPCDGLSGFAYRLRRDREGQRGKKKEALEGCRVNAADREGSCTLSARHETGMHGGSPDKWRPWAGPTPGEGTKRDFIPDVVGTTSDKICFVSAVHVSAGRPGGKACQTNTTLLRFREYLSGPPGGGRGGPEQRSEAVILAGVA